MDALTPKTVPRARPSPEMIASCVCLGLLVVAGIVYLPLLSAGFIDQTDQYYLHGVVDVRSAAWTDVWTALQHFHFPPGAAPRYQPLVTWSLLLDGSVVRDWRAANVQFHLTNYLLHLLSVGLLFAIVRRVSGSTLWAVLCAALFGLHPVQVESVAWVAQRGTLLGTFFALLTLLTYLQYRKAERFRWFLLVTFCYAAALLSEPAFIGLPIVLLILDIWPLNRRDWPPVVEKMPLLVLLLACGALHYYLFAHVQQAGGGRAPALGALQLLTRNLAGMAAKMVWPAALTPFQPFPSHAAASGLGVLIDAAVLFILPAALIFSFRFSRPVFTALAGTVVLVFPGLVNAPFAGQMLGDHYVYAFWIVPCIAWAAWVKPHGHALRLSWGRCTVMAAAAVAATFAARANIETYYWRDSRELCQHAIGLYPEWSGGYVALVESYIREADLDSALFWAERAVHEVPDDPSAEFYLGRVLLLHQDGRSAEAIGPLRKALAGDPDWIDCLHNLGVALLDTGQASEAVRYLERARDLQPHLPAIRLNLGTAYLKAGRPAAARGEFQVVLDSYNDPQAHLGLAKAWAANGNPELARRHLAAAVAVDPHFAVLAARYPELRRLRDQPGFESLIDLSEPPSQGKDPESGDRGGPLPSRSSPGL